MFKKLFLISYVLCTFLSREVLAAPSIKFVCLAKQGADSVGVVDALRAKAKPKKVKLKTLRSVVFNIEARIAKLNLKNQKSRSTLTKKLNLEKKKLIQAEKTITRCLARVEFRGQDDSLQPYRDNITANEVRHLLDKVAFGGDWELQNYGETHGLNALVNRLLQPVVTTQPDPSGNNGQGGVSREYLDNFLTENDVFWAKKTINYSHPDRMNVPVWHVKSIQHPQFYRFLFSGSPFAEWMQLNFHNHFAVNLNGIFFSYQPYYHYGLVHYWDLLKYGSLGNFQTLAESMAFDPSMNYWLNNKDNSVYAVNQNYAREMLELFILGANNPHSNSANYGEESIIASTGFTSGFYEVSPWGVPVEQRPQWIMPHDDQPRSQDVITISYAPELHDFTNRLIFPNFGPATANANFTHKSLVAHTLYNHSSAAVYIAERFAGMMLYPGISSAMSRELGDTLVNNGYDLIPFYKKILISEAMFSNRSKESCVTSPIEQLVHLARKMFRFRGLPRDYAANHPYDPTNPANMDNSTKVLESLLSGAGAAGQQLFESPSVFGWKGSCNINRNGSISAGEGWVSAQKLLNRDRACMDLMDKLRGLNYSIKSGLGLWSGITLYQLLDYIGQSFFNLHLSEEQMLIIAKLYLNKPGITVAPLSNPLIAKIPLDEDFLWRKVPRTICMIGGLVEANRR